MDGTDEYAVTSLDLDALAVSDRFRFTPADADTDDPDDEPPEEWRP